MSDIELASAAAHSARAVRGVVDLSPGLVAPAATYGPGQRVAGIIVHHPTMERVILEVHVILSESHCERAWADLGLEPDEHDAGETGPVTEIASRVRDAVCATVQSMAPQGRVRVDVFIDDLQ